MLLITFPELKERQGLVAERLQAAGATSEIITIWHDLVAQELSLSDEDDEF